MSVGNVHINEQHKHQLVSAETPLYLALNLMSVYLKKILKSIKYTWEKRSHFNIIQIYEQKTQIHHFYNLDHSG